MKARWIATMLVISLARSAAAEEVAPSAPSPEETTARAEARGRFEDGVALAQQERWEGALDAFEASLAAWPTPVAHFNRCLCLRRLERVALALSCYQELLSRFPDEADAQDLAEARRELTRLAARIGAITVEVEGPEGALVTIDGVEAGSSPLEGRLFVEPGRHSIEVRADGFVPSRRELELAEGSDVTIHVALEPAGGGLGTVLVEVSTPGVTVLLDGRELGISPLLDQAFVAAAGAHLIEGRRPGYQPAQAELRLTAGQASRVALEMTPLEEIPPTQAGTLEVSVSEAEAEILLDGSPLTTITVPIGPHRLEVRREGFQPWSREVEVVSNEPNRFEIELRPTEVFLERYQARARSSRAGAWASGGVGVAALGAALGLLIWNIDRRDQWTTENEALEGYTGPDRLRRIEENANLEQSIDQVAGVGWAIMGLGAAAAITSAVLFALGPRPDRYRQLSLLPGPGGFGVRLRW